jgi:hypothetical protein
MDVALGGLFGRARLENFIISPVSSLVGNNK